MSYYSHNSESAFGGFAGLGQAAQHTGSAMDAIIATSRSARAKFEAMRASPMQARSSASGTNEARGVVLTLQDAAKRAETAKKAEATAKALAAAGDKRGAAQKAIVALQQARDAIILANKAEKTRLTRALDVMAKQLESQAEYLSAMSEMEMKSRGPTLGAMKQQATAKTLSNAARTLKQKSAAVAAVPEKPPAAPTDSRIAELASKYNIRTAKDLSTEQQQAQSSVLSDLAEAPLAQVRDYEGAFQYYGADGLGKLMADLEFAAAGLPETLHSAIHRVADVTSLQVMADASTAFEQARALSARVSQAAPGSTGLAGLGALGGEWEDWCDQKVPTGATESARAYSGNVSKCKTWIPFLAPWTTAGIIARGGSLTAGQVVDAAKVAVTETGKVVASSPSGGTNKTPAQLQAEAAAKQAAIDATARGPSLADQFKAAAGSAYTTGTAAVSKVPAYVWGLGAVVALGGVYFYTRRPSRFSY